MKTRNYEKKELINFLILLVLISEIIFIFLLFKVKEDKYIKINSIVIKDNLVLVVVDKNNRKVIYSNEVLYLDDKLKKYKIREDRGLVIDKKYYQILLELEIENKKTNDVLALVIKSKKFRLIEMFKIIWEGG